jgi:Tfp pilus assembly protein PilF
MNASCPNCHFDDCLEADRYCIKCGHRLARASTIEEDCAATKRVYDSTMVHVRLGLVYMQNGKRDRAVASWKAALDIDPENEEALALLQKYGSEEAIADDKTTIKAKAA